MYYGNLLLTYLLLFFSLIKLIFLLFFFSIGIMELFISIFFVDTHTHTHTHTLFITSYSQTGVCEGTAGCSWDDEKQVINKKI